ncbi:histidine phosphatase family protein [Nocardioides sp. CFH 31398]|uniref:histidine phosphatase family protein n=1 Tax=Nocardioides sp. CFH 31398 TaxID=2919579 RepID=UPI001F06633F|nr:histidine phosphatase family protein [Nocardioides sp. CFH 31398]MCH1867821.1 histidine phosphatase family protein [Nocardioides sp. CFH 31398]
MRLLLLRHAEVDGHRGDVPITEAGAARAREVGAWLSAEGDVPVQVLYGGTRRTRETAEALVAGWREARDENSPPEPRDAFALRNPDLYLAGERVTMVSSPEAFATQTASATPDDVTASGFFSTWLSHPDRVGWWVAHAAPPGDTAAQVADRVAAFAASLTDVPGWRGRTVVAVTHSPVLRAVALRAEGGDPGEPPYVAGYEITDPAGGQPGVRRFTPPGA